MTLHLGFETQAAINFVAPPMVWLAEACHAVTSDRKLQRVYGNSTCRPTPRYGFFLDPKFRGRVHKSSQLDTKPHGPMIHILPCVRKFSGSNVYPETRYPQWATMWFSSVPAGKFRNGKLDQATTSWFYSLSNWLFTNHSTNLSNSQRCNKCEPRMNQIQQHNTFPQDPYKYYPLILTLYIPWVVVISPFIDHHLFTIEFVCRGFFEGNFPENLICITKITNNFRKRKKPLSLSYVDTFNNWLIPKLFRAVISTTESNVELPTFCR
jgi:hypothetical protein